MKKEKSIQADIELLKELQGGVLSDRWGKAITRSIQALEAMRDKPEMKSAGRTVCKKCNEIFQPILKKVLEENKELRKRLDDWIYELAYYTEDEVATPKGVKKFVGKALEDKTKEIDDLREQLHNKMFKREELDMEDKTDIFGEFGIWVWGKTIPSDVDKCQEFMRMSPLGKYIEQLENRIHLLYNEAKQAQTNALKASEVKPKPLSTQKIFHAEEKEFLRLWHAYHAKYKIPYSHDEAKDFFLKLTVIFAEEC